MMEMLQAEEPPQDVLVSTLAGSIRAQVKLLTLQKQGRDRNQLFISDTNHVLVALTGFVQECQMGIRRFYSDTREGKVFTTQTSRRLVQELPQEKLRELIDSLSAAPDAPTLTTTVKSTFYSKPGLMIGATVLVGLALGAALQSLAGSSLEGGLRETLQRVVGLDERVLLPLLLVVVGCLICLIGNISTYRTLRKPLDQYERDQMARLRAPARSCFYSCCCCQRKAVQSNHSRTKSKTSGIDVSQLASSLSLSEFHVLHDRGPAAGDAQKGIRRVEGGAGFGPFGGKQRGLNPSTTAVSYGSLRPSEYTRLT